MVGSLKGGCIMPDKSKAKSLEQLMVEADELIQQIDSFIVDDINDEHLHQFEKTCSRSEKN
jgi:hypothetical protein